MYVLYVTVLTVGAYLAPGLALLPRAAYDSRLAYAVPIISTLLTTGLARVLKPLGAFTETHVLIASLALVVLAIFRVWLLRTRTAVHWPAAHQFIYLGSLCVGLFAAGRLGLSGFEIHDEIYSWNLWAIQHARGESHDLSFTRAPYPQTFSYLIAWNYQLLQSIDLQLPVKCSLAILVASMVAAIGTACRNCGAWSLCGFAGLAGALLLATSEFSWGITRGYAETLMVPALTVSVALYIQWKRYPDRTSWLWLASGCAVVAGLTKQPALLWLMLVFPMLVAAGRRPRDNAALIPVALAICIGVVWLLTEGARFWENPHPIRHSQQGRDWFEQLLYASQKYLIKQPALSLMLILSAYYTLCERSARGVYFLLIVPCLFLWLFFGAYEARLGTHVLALSALLIAAHDYWPSGRRIKLGRPNGLSTSVRCLALGVIAVVAIIAGNHAWNIYKRHGPEFSFYDGGKNTIYTYFGDDAAFVYNEVYKSASTLWIPSHYIYGIFYSHNPIIRPTNRKQNFNAAHIRTQILRDRPDYVFDAGIVMQSPMGSILREFLQRCKDWFDVVASPPNLYTYAVYRLKTDVMERKQECAR